MTFDEWLTIKSINRSEWSIYIIEVMQEAWDAAKADAAQEIEELKKENERLRSPNVYKLTAVSNPADHIANTGFDPTEGYGW